MWVSASKHNCQQKQHTLEWVHHNENVEKERIKRLLSLQHWGQLLHRLTTAL